MIKQIIKMLWNQKRSYYGIFIEQLLIGIILMLCIVSVTDAVKKYNDPGLLDVNNTLTFGYMIQNEYNNPDIRNNAQQSMIVVRENLRKLPYVESISVATNLVPYMRPDNSYNNYSDSITIDDKRFKTIVKHSDEYGISVFKVKMEEGTWIENHPLEDGSIPVVITRQFADKAGWSSAVGKKITVMARIYTVVGVASGLKQQSFDPSPIAIVLPSYMTDGNNDMYSENAARIKDGTQGAFYDAFYKEFRRLIPNQGVEPLVYDIQTMKGIFMSESILSIVLQSIPTIFLFLFAFIGTFGLYWLNSRKRYREFAVRLAMGSTKKQLISIVVGESIMITCLALIPALLLSVFIYEYTFVYLIAISITIIAMLVFSVISAWYPAWKVSKVNPAEALQYE